MDTQLQLPVVFDVVDGVPMRVTMYPSGHMAIGLEEFMKDFGISPVPPVLSEQVQKFLRENYSGKVLTEDDGKKISEEVACIARAHIAGPKKTKKRSKKV